MLQLSHKNGGAEGWRAAILPHAADACPTLCGRPHTHSAQSKRVRCNQGPLPPGGSHRDRPHALLRGVRKEEHVTAGSSPTSSQSRQALHRELHSQMLHSMRHAACSRLLCLVRRTRLPLLERLPCECDCLLHPSGPQRPALLPKRPQRGRLPRFPRRVRVLCG